MPGKTALVAAAVAGFVLAVGSGPSHAGTIKGRVTFDGTPPSRRMMDMTADPACVKLIPDGRLGEVMVIDENRGIANVFVYLSGGDIEGKTFEKPSTAAHMTQVGCMFTPRVFGVMANQAVEIENGDPFLHNVHSLPKKSRQFNLAMPFQNQVIKKKFTSAEVMVRIKCDVHPWMAAYIGVLKHPFHATSGSDGTYEMKDVPAGTYTVDAWHERLEAQQGTITVTADGSATLDFTFKPLKQPSK